MKWMIKKRRKEKERLHGVEAKEAIMMAIMLTMR